jgi:hypothetical protein
LPNTLIHIAVQAPLSRGLFRKIEIPWILAGAIIPDIPWIFQRAAIALQLADPYQIRLYVTIQASLCFCLLFSIALASFSRRPLRIFALLSFNCTIHLLLDALQIKWGNGVHFFAPFSWQPTNFGVFWPEHFSSYFIALFAIIYLLLNAKTIIGQGLNITPPSKRRLTAAILPLLVYLAFPLTLMSQLEESDSNHIWTLKHKENRIGKYVEIDRAYYSIRDDKITIFTDESFTLTGNTPEKSGTISIRGEFTAPHIIKTSMFHMHNGYRNYASQLGLLLSLIIWGYLLFMERRETHKHLKLRMVK